MSKSRAQPLCPLHVFEVYLQKSHKESQSLNLLSIHHLSVTAIFKITLFSTPPETFGYAILSYEPHREKTGLLPMRKQRR